MSNLKGVINENIIDMLNLRSLDDVLKEKGVETAAKTEVVDEDTQMIAMRELSAKLSMIEGADHSEAMDELHAEILQHARDLMTYGFNIDHPRARGIFEVAAMFFNHAITTKNSKRDAQLKTMKLALDRKRADLEERRHPSGTQSLDGDNTILVEDRNELLRRIRQKLSDPNAIP